MATLFTGLHPLRHQVAASTDRIPKEVTTLAEILKSRGFSTLGVSTNGHVSQAWGFARGFDEFLPTWKLGLGDFAASSRVNELLFPRLENLREPYFLFVHYLDPHQPYDPELAFDGGPVPARLKALAPLREGESYPNLGTVDPELVRAASDLYDGEVRSNDRSIGELLARLRELGLDRNALFVVTSDHGEEFFEHGRSGHGKALYAESTAVPLIFQAEGVVCPGIELGRMGLEDVLPTVLSLLGIDRPMNAASQLDGVDQANALRCLSDVEESPRLLYLEGDPDAGLGMVSGNQKLLLAYEPYGKTLFDLERDPGERFNLLSSGGETGSELTIARLLADRYNDLVHRAFRRDSTTADQELLKQLSALGYGGAHNAVAARRTFPRRLRPADALVGGLRGWENVDGFQSCPDVREDPARQLLQGWWRPTPDEPGRWTAPAGTFALRVPQAVAGRLSVQGVNYRPDAVALELRHRGGAGVWSGPVLPGPFAIELEVQGLSPGGISIFSFKADPPFVPTEHGLSDARVMGIFIEAICLHPAS
jgi:arylsulfatase A-like enzyme